MKINNPKSKFDLKISWKDLVLEVGGGHNPHLRSNVVVEKFYSDNFHRSGDVKLQKQQQLVIADGELLPFKDQAFDYVMSIHVLEHIDHPEAFFSEMERVGGRGYIEAPSLIGEHLIPKKSHQWVLLNFRNQLVMVHKKNTAFIPEIDFGNLLLYFFAQRSIGFKIFKKNLSKCNDGALSVARQDRLC